VEGVRKRKDDSRLHVAIVRVPIMVSGGQIEFYAIYRDISEHRRAEQSLREFTDRLQTLSRRLLELQEVERRHLARELHDEVGQLLTGLRMLLKPNDGQSADAVQTRLEQARSILDQLLDKVRGLSFDLRPAVLDQLGLLPALLALFERYTQQTGVLVDFKHKGVEGRFAAEVETTAYRIVQEALTNVARHAGVGGVTVRVWVGADMLSVQIEDRGRGFEAQVVQAKPGSGGLAGMHERVRLLNGRLIIESEPGAGTRITAELPLRGTGPKRGETGR
jgi:signal transduction histidine kinase